MFRPELLVICRELPLVRAAYVSNYMSEIPHTNKIIAMMTKC